MPVDKKEERDAFLNGAVSGMPDDEATDPEMTSAADFVEPTHPAAENVSTTQSPVGAGLDLQTDQTEDSEMLAADAAAPSASATLSPVEGRLDLQTDQAEDSEMPAADVGDPSSSVTLSPVEGRLELQPEEDSVTEGVSVTAASAPDSGVSGGPMDRPADDSDSTAIPPPAGVRSNTSEFDGPLSPAAASTDNQTSTVSSSAGVTFAGQRPNTSEFGGSLSAPNDPPTSASTTASPPTDQPREPNSSSGHTFVFGCDYKKMGKTVKATIKVNNKAV